MTGALFKHTTDDARRASFALPPPPQAAVPKAPSPLESALAEARAQVRGLQADLAAMEEGRQAEVAEAREAGRRQALDEFRAADQDRTAVLERALLLAREDFQRGLEEACGPLAARLAIHALERLVRVEDEEGRWLARSIARRLDDLSAETLVALHVAPGDGPDVSPDVSLPAGAALVPDATQRPGTARLALRLGEISIDPAEGLARILGVLRGEREDAADG